jgi:succinyl-CoA synthetase beta subunit
MKLHEYQAKGIFTKYGIPVPRGRVTSNASEAKHIAYDLGDRVVIKAQVLVGGRGKAGGIRLAKSIEDVTEIAASVLGMDIKGLPVKKVLIEEGVNIGNEFYIGITNDRAEKKPVIMASSEGGIDIEEVARKTPEKILTLHVDPMLGLMDYQIREIAMGIDLPFELWRPFTKIAAALWKIYATFDATLVEINPLVVTKDGQFIALDAKMTVDENALFRQTEIDEQRDTDSDDPIEIEARKYGLTYIKLEGDIGCMVNGAGLAMATMDTIKLNGGLPANFLDIGGGANAEKVSVAFQTIMADKDVKAILVNIFGGITRCDEVARGILQATAVTKPDIPIVTRLIGTNAEEGLKILAEENMVTATTLMEAAQKVIALAKEPQP